jgi:hypothetical protein
MGALPHGNSGERDKDVNDMSGIFRRVVGFPLASLPVLTLGLHDSEELS